LCNIDTKNAALQSWTLLARVAWAISVLSCFTRDTSFKKLMRDRVILKRMWPDGMGAYLAPDSLQNSITSLYRAAGLATGYSSHSGRRMFANRLVAQGHSLETVQIYLRNSHLDHVAPYLDVSQRELHEAVAAIDLSC
jgi:site-specific recombinase XerD